MVQSVSFYFVPLVCEAVSAIGCGCRAKPVMARLEQVPEIERVWLHRQGDLLAIGWRNEPSRERQLQLAQAAFDIPTAPPVSPVPPSTQRLAGFPDPREWFRHDTVDALSEQEACTIAARVLRRLRRQGLSLPQGLELASGLGDALREILVSDEPMSMNVRRDRLVGVAREVLLRHLGCAATQLVERTVSHSTLLQEHDEDPGSGSCRV